MSQHHSIRILHCPTTVGGNPSGLSGAERELGLDSVIAIFEQNWLGYNTDYTIFNGIDRVFLQEWKRWKFLFSVFSKFDIIHFNNGSTLAPVYVGQSSANVPFAKRLKRSIYKFYARSLDMIDLPLLKKAGKKIVVTYQGDDARQGEYCLKHFSISPATEVDAEYYKSPGGDRIKAKRIKKFSKYADRIYALNPDLLHVLPPNAEFMPYASVDMRHWKMVGVSSARRKPIVLHAPTHRQYKGTKYIFEAVNRLRKEGIELEFVLVEGIPHSEARRLYERADLLVDQVLVGWYGALAVELMALGKPVICYIREDDLHFIPPQMRAELPIINATPATIYQVLKEWLTVRRHELAELGLRSRVYVKRWHDPLKIAARLKSVYESLLDE